MRLETSRGTSKPYSLCMPHARRWQCAHHCWCYFRFLHFAGASSSATIKNNDSISLRTRRADKIERVPVNIYRSKVFLDIFSLSFLFRGKKQKFKYGWYWISYLISFRLASSAAIAAPHPKSFRLDPFIPLQFLQHQNSFDLELRMETNGYHSVRQKRNGSSACKCRTNEFWWPNFAIVESNRMCAERHI